MGILDDFSFSTPPAALSDTWLAATNFGGSDGSWVTPRTSDTVPTNAVQSMAPVTAANDGGGWSDFWKGALTTAIGYSIQKDAVQSGVVRPATGTPQAAQAQVVAQRGLLSNPLVLGAIGLGIFLAVKKG
jgi:hypothetical protein